MDDAQRFMQEELLSIAQQIERWTLEIRRMKNSLRNHVTSINALKCQRERTALAELIQNALREIETLESTTGKLKTEVLRREAEAKKKLEKTLSQIVDIRSL